MKKKTLIHMIFKTMIIFSIILSYGFFSPLFADTPKKIVVLPFEINADQDISYIRAGIQSMLSSRLAWKDKLKVLDYQSIEPALNRLKKLPENDMILRLGKQFDADYIVTGSITNFEGAYSFDTKVYNLAKSSFLTFYDQTTDVDNVIKKMDIIAAKINKKVFNKTTTVYEKYEKERVITEEDLKRMNPNKMMPIRKETQEADKPFWKFW